MSFVEPDRRGLLAMLGGAVAAGSASAQPAGTKPQARPVYDRAIIIDAQGGIGDPDPRAGPDDPPSRMMLDEVKTSGVTVISLTVGEVGNGPDRFAGTLEALANVGNAVASAPDHFMVIQRGADIRHAKETGRLGLIPNLQDTTAIETDLGRVARLRSAGVRVIQLTYNKRNLCGDGSLEPANAGISDFGRQMIAEINKRKVVLDLSHGGQRTIAESVQATAAPPAITHTGCRDLVDNPRNVWDRELRAVADKGGVVGIYFMPFLAKSGMAHKDDLIAHIEHAAKVCGEDHIGLGTDGGLSALVIDDKARKAQKEFYEERKARGIAAPGEAADVFNIVAEYNSPARFRTLAHDLGKRGWSDARIEKLLGANFARLFQDVWGT
jgi:membrane dipeptidase